MTNDNNNIIKELEEISPLLAGIPRHPVFTLPEGYFNDLSQHILLKINKEYAHSAVPEGYFDNLADHIMHKIRATEATNIIEELPPILASVSRENVHHVPAGYFDSLAQQITLKVAKPRARVISIAVFSGFARYAAAAVITGILGLGLFSRLNNKPENYNMEPILANAETIISSGSFETELNKLDEVEITEYLEAYGHDVEAAILASAAETHELPDAIDYVLQENTLDQFKDKFDIAE
jgi:hypothetical protein